jgi:predicted permease
LTKSGTQPAIYKREPTEVAGMVLISTAISFGTLPLLLLYLLNKI